MYVFTYMYMYTHTQNGILDCQKLGVAKCTCTYTRNSTSQDTKHLGILGVRSYVSMCIILSVAVGTCMCIVGALGYIYELWDIPGWL